MWKPVSWRPVLARSLHGLIGLTCLTPYGGREGPCLLNAKMWQMGANVLVQKDLPKSPKMLASPAATPEKAQELHPQFSQNTIQ